MTADGGIAIASWTERESFSEPPVDGLLHLSTTAIMSNPDVSEILGSFTLARCFGVSTSIIAMSFNASQTGVSRTTTNLLWSDNSTSLVSTHLGRPLGTK